MAFERRRGEAKQVSIRSLHHDIQRITFPCSREEHKCLKQRVQSCTKTASYVPECSKFEHFQTPIRVLTWRKMGVNAGGGKEQMGREQRKRDLMPPKSN